MSNTSFIFQKPKDFYLKRDKEIGPFSQIIFSKNYKEFTKLTLGKGQNYEYHNVENQKEHRKSWRRSLHRKDL